MANIGNDFKLEEKTLYENYKNKLLKLSNIEKENETVGQVFTKGLLPVYVLYILSLGPTNGNDIAHQIGERTRGLWIPSTGGIYPLLKKLEKQKFIEGNWDDSQGRMQKIYKLTEAGRMEFNERRKLLKVKIEEVLEVFKIIYKDLYK